MNNPEEKGVTHDKIKETLSSLKSVVYWCMADEIGNHEQTPHTHIYLVASAPIRFSTIKKKFPTAHMEQARGSNEENRAYIEKSGKWAEDEKADTCIPDTFEEWGAMPIEHQGARSDWNTAYEMLTDGASVMDVIRWNPAMMRYRTTLEQFRQEIIAEQFRETFRQLEVTYIYGPTEFGKTRYVMEQYGYENVYKITDYGRGCFDAYKCEDVLLLDEYTSSFRVQDINNYLDGYPLMLPCRYTNRVACYTKVYIISNIRLEFQYPNVKSETPSIWNAFTRRIHQVMIFYEPGRFDAYATREYLAPPPNPKLDTWREVPDNGDLPF